MKLTLKSLSIIAVLSFTLSFVTGMSATMMYQEHKSLVAAAEMTADANIENYNF